MVLYLDTSSLVKLYVEEEGSDGIIELVACSAAVATSLVAYAEARSAFARRFREKAFTRDEYKGLIVALDQDWNRVISLAVTEDLVFTAGRLAEKHGIRGFDAIHLASATVLKEEVSASVLFSCADQRLQKASAKEGLQQP